MRSFAPLIAVLLLTACISEGESRTAEVTDSAGVRIVENRAPAWGQGEGGWRVDPEPTLVIGRAEGAEEYQLHHARVARRHPGGGVLVANTGSSRILRYDGQGRHVRSLGREGSGPGEFRTLWDIWPWRGDSVIAYDVTARRITVFDSAGGVGRSPGVETSGHLIDVAPDGTLIFMALRSRDDGLQLATVTLRSADEGVLGTTAEIPYLRTRRIDLGDGRMVLGNDIFSLPTSFATGHERLYVATGRAPEILVHGLDGTLVGRIRWEEEDPTVRPSHVEAFIEERLAPVRDPEQRRRRRAEIEEAPVAERFPAVSDLEIDPEGYLWAEVFRRPGETRARWRVFTPEGELLGTVPMPPGFRPTEFGRDYVLGLATDELGVQRVRRHALTRE